MLNRLNIAGQKEVENYFSPKPQQGKSLPNPKSVSDMTPFYLQASDGVYVEHIMFNGKWHKKVVDSENQIILEEI